MSCTSTRSQAHQTSLPSSCRQRPRKLLQGTRWCCLLIHTDLLGTGITSLILTRSAPLRLIPRIRTQTSAPAQMCRGTAPWHGDSGSSTRQPSSSTGPATTRSSTTIAPVSLSFISNLLHGLPLSPCITSASCLVLVWCGNLTHSSSSLLDFLGWRELPSAHRPPARERQ